MKRFNGVPYQTGRFARGRTIYTKAAMSWVVAILDADCSFELHPNYTGLAKAVVNTGRLAIEERVPMTGRNFT